MMAQLAGFGRQLDALDEEIGNIEASLDASQLLPGQARDSLAQVEAQLDKLQCHGLDSVDTFDLQSGKLEAKSLRKSLTHRGEVMHQRIEAIFARIKELMQK